MGVYDQIKTAFQDVIAPQIHEVRGEMHALRADIQRLDEKIDNLDQRLSSKIDNLDARLNDRIDNLDARLTAKIDGLRGEMVAEIRRLDTRIDGLDTRMDDLGREIRTAIDVRERLAALEAAARRS